MPKPKLKLPGVVSGLGVTFRTMMKPAVTVQYPHEREDPPARARGVIALKEENCTVCMLCARQCPDWCIYIEGHKTKAPPRREGGKPRTVQLLDRFDIDYGLCMYCRRLTAYVVPQGPRQPSRSPASQSFSGTLPLVIAYPAV